MIQLKKCICALLTFIITIGMLSGCDKATKEKGPKVGEYITFGTYEQDNDLNNGKEDIEWLVLEKEENRVLLISKYVLDRQPFDNTVKYAYNRVNYSNSSLRVWLNDDFKNVAFNFEEQSKIEDVFLLSCRSAEVHFDSNLEEQLKCKYTEYARRNINYIGDREEIRIYGDWWLSDQLLANGSPTGCICYVSYNGDVRDDAGCYPTAELGVRPAIQLNLSE